MPDCCVVLCIVAPQVGQQPEGSDSEEGDGDGEDQEGEQVDEVDELLKGRQVDEGADMASLVSTKLAINDEQGTAQVGGAGIWGLGSCGCYLM